MAFQNEMNKSSFRYFFFPVFATCFIFVSSKKCIWLKQFSRLSRSEIWMEMETTADDSNWSLNSIFKNVLCFQPLGCSNMNLKSRYKLEIRLLARDPHLFVEWEREEKKNCSRLRKSIWNSLNCRCKIVRLNRERKKKKSLLKMVNLDKNARRQSSDVKEI